MSESLTIIPDIKNAYDLARHDMLCALDRVEKCQDGASAQIYIQRAIETGKPHFPFGDLIRAIELRLPEATPYQTAFVSFIKQKLTGNIFMGRALGAFNDQVLVLVANQKSEDPFCVILQSVPDMITTLPDWDVIRPEKRRIWKEDVANE